MDLTGLLNAVKALALSQYIRDSLLAFPLIEAFHVVFLALVFGTIMVVDLRLLGIASKSRPFGALESDIVKWTWLAFIGAVVTGGLMFITNPIVYFENVAFRIKILLLVAAGANMLVFERVTRRTHKDWDLAPVTPSAARLAAVLSLILWTGVIGAGRVIGFTIGHTAVVPPPTAADVNFDDFLSADSAPPAAPQAPPAPWPSP